MSETEDFLARWSRRKRAAAERPAEPATPAAPTPAAAEPTAGEAKAAAAPAAEIGARGCDTGQLPPLESIGPDTDLGAFFQPGVPDTLRHAALRRAWSADPAIRDFRGLQENDFDFTSPDTPGFGPLGPDVDVKAMISRLFGEVPDEPDAPAEPTQPAAAPVVQNADQTRESERPGQAPDAPPDDSAVLDHRTDIRCDDLLQRTNNAASQNDSVSEPDRSRRRHGGALPQDS